ncbi:unnamed protein product [Linum trigynum]|uniref:Uncharacterized protein n=1 Tax=Linum trigynum TaxID=586398 RepID=A0AAV2DUI4_9ROSI
MTVPFDELGIPLSLCCDSGVSGLVWRCPFFCHFSGCSSFCRLPDLPRSRIGTAVATDLLMQLLSQFDFQLTTGMQAGFSIGG